MSKWRGVIGLTVTVLGMAFMSLKGVNASEPETTSVLKVSSGPNDAVGQTFSINDLRALDIQDIETTTIWTEGKHVFSGVSLYGLLKHVGAKGDDFQAIALNDYAVTIPMEDAHQGGPIVAFEIDGQLIPRREKGPLWIVYPFDASQKYQTEVIYSRSIWQLNRLIINE